MGRVTRSRAEVLLRVPAPEGADTLGRWTDELGDRLRRTDGPRLVDCWLVADDGVFIAVLDGPDATSFRWLGEATASVLGISSDAVELRALTGMRDRWAFRGEPAVEDRTRRVPRPTRWRRTDIGPDDQTLRIEFVHGVPDGLHHVDLYEDDEEVRVTVYLGLDHDFTGGGYVMLGLGAWTTARTAAPVGGRSLSDGADAEDTIRRRSSPSGLVPGRWRGRLRPPWRRAGP